MPNLATLLKSEIARLASREVRAQTQKLKNATAHYRTEIAALKRRALALEQEVKRLSKAVPRKMVSAVKVDPEVSLQRYRAGGLVAHRNRLGLTVAEMAKLLGVSGQSLHKWETGKSRPRDKQFPAIAMVRKLNKAQAREQLETLGK